MKLYQYNKETSKLYKRYKNEFQELEMICNLTDNKMEYHFLQKHEKRETLLIRTNKDSIEITDYSECGYIKVFISPEMKEQIQNKIYGIKPKRKDTEHFYVNVPLYLFNDFFLVSFIGYDNKLLT